MRGKLGTNPRFQINPKHPRFIYFSITRFDAFRSIFPAGTVSGAPKIKAIELVAELEKERRGVYAGAVGRIGFAKDEMDMCIAIRTMVFKDGIVYFQAGGGIVFDSVEEDEYMETINKLLANVRAVEEAEGESFLNLVIAKPVVTYDLTYKMLCTRYSRLQPTQVLNCI